jgi:hypothetical protein
MGGSGTLTLEVLDPEDQVVGRVEGHVEAFRKKGEWQADVHLQKPLAVEHLMWHRLRYGFKFANQENASPEGVETVSQILRTPVVRIIGQHSYLTGSHAAVRVVVTDSRNEGIGGPGSLRI